VEGLLRGGGGGLWKPLDLGGPTIPGAPGQIGAAVPREEKRTIQMGDQGNALYMWQLLNELG
jgi:hypothetical protein